MKIPQELRPLHHPKKTIRNNTKSLNNNIKEVFSIKSNNNNNNNNKNNNNNNYKVRGGSVNVKSGVGNISGGCAGGGATAPEDLEAASAQQQRQGVTAPRDYCRRASSAESLDKEEEACPGSAPAPGKVKKYNKKENKKEAEEIEKGAGSRGTIVSLCNMVAAMNELLSSTTTTNSVCSKTANIKDSINKINDSDKSIILATVDSDNKTVGLLGFPCDFDHMYASMTDGGAPVSATSALGVSPLRGDELRRNDISEVKHLKELLLLHLDLIQQQSEQIVTKDKLLSALRQENENLKLRLERMDRRVNSQKLRPENTENLTDYTGPCSPPNFPSTSDHQYENVLETVPPQYNESFKIRLNTVGGITTVKQEIVENDRQESSGESRQDEWSNKSKRKSDSLSMNTAKRKRGVSSSSTVSNDTSSTIQDNKSLIQEDLKNLEKKNKSLINKESFLTTDELYYTAIGDTNYWLNLKEPLPPDSSILLEVPSWRIKSYSSCYTMEGTENLDDEIFNKRHLKLENDERRRKRWDFQRIREQRHIEKLRQRQERQNHHAACYNINHSGPCQSPADEDTVSSLWPDLDHIQSIQVDDVLPVCGFGDFIPSFTPSGFFLPWLIKKAKSRRRPKRLTCRRRKSSKR